MSSFPAFPGLIPLKIKHKPRIDSILTSQNTMLSAYSFVAHYIWRDHFNFHWGIIDGYFCLFAQYDDYVYMPVPPVSLEKNISNPSALPFSKGGIKEVPSSAIINEVFNIMDKINNNKAVSRIENIDESWIDSFVAAGYKIKPGEPEYVYLRKDLATIKGDPYKSKRVMCNYFEKHYRYSYEPIESGHAVQCIELFNLWRQIRAKKVSDSFFNAILEDSFRVHIEAINNYETLELSGRVVIIDNKVEGYIFGFERNKDLLYALLEVTNPCIKGLAQFIFREFCREKDGYRYINTMGDSGLENLRTVKQSYRPVCLAQAFTAYMD
ncbi:MAG: DUF2156 domain-containing protein [Nitrospirae bacterium]|nr:DUF2156 domain-containing protein [Nitrospirota bacterium]